MEMVAIGVGKLCVYGVYATFACVCVCVKAYEKMSMYICKYMLCENDSPYQSHKIEHKMGHDGFGDVFVHILTPMLWSYSYQQNISC